MFGGGSRTRSFVSLLALIALFITTGATAMGVMEASKSTDPNSKWGEEYIIPAAIGAIFCVLFLMYLVSTSPGKSNAYKLIVIFILLAGVLAETYMTLLLNQTQTGSEVITMIVIVLNWLFRTFLVLEYVQQEWSPLFPKAAKAVAAATSTGVSTSTSIGTSSGPTTDVKKELKDRVKDYVSRLDAKIKADDKRDSSGALVRVRDIGVANGAINAASDPKLGDLQSFIDKLVLTDGSKATTVLARGGRR